MAGNSRLSIMMGIFMALTLAACGSGSDPGSGKEVKKPQKKTELSVKAAKTEAKPPQFPEDLKEADIRDALSKFAQKVEAGEVAVVPQEPGGRGLTWKELDAILARNSRNIEVFDKSIVVKDSHGSSITAKQIQATVASQTKALDEMVVPPEFRSRKSTSEQINELAAITINPQVIMEVMPPRNEQIRDQLEAFIQSHPSGEIYPESTK